jgi:glycerol uptake facilitator-like aquaporin
VSDTGAPAPGGGTPFRAIISVIETAAFAIAVVFAGIKGGHLNPETVIALTSGFLAHAVNHPAGGSPI